MLLKKNRFGVFRTFLYVGLIVLFAANLSRVSATPLNRFRILIDTNQMNISEINQMNTYPYNPLGVDGVWAITQNYCGLHCESHGIPPGFSQTNPDVPPSEWPNVFLKLNAANWTISEDEANYFLKEINNNARVAAQSYIYPSPVRESLAYYEYYPLLPPDCEKDPVTCGPLIPPDVIESEVPLFGDRIIFLSRNYLERDPADSGEAYWVRQGLDNAPHAAGVVFEINPDTITGGDTNHTVEGLNECLSRPGKSCYLLLAPNRNPTGTTENLHYGNDVTDAVAYLNSRGVPLNNPNLYVVLAIYGREESKVGFMTGDSGSGFNNSVWAASQQLQTYRNTILPQATIGYIDSVSSSGASGWTLDPETFAASSPAITVHLYVDGSTFVGSATANISRSDVNAATGFLGDHGFSVPIPPQYLDSHPHAWSAYGISASGNPAKNSLLGNSPITVTLPDTIPPTVYITAPFSGQNVAGTAVTVSATASDNVGVVGVQFKLDGANLGGEDTTPPYSISWNTTLATPGTHTLTAVARDAVNNNTTSAPITVTVDNTPPSGVNITAPFNSEQVAGTAVTVSAVASDANMNGVQFKLDGASLGSLDKTVPYSVIWNTTTATEGVHTLTAMAKDQAGNTTTSPAVMVTVDNTPPTGVFVTAPANGATVSGTVTVSGTASDANIKGVQFQVDGASLGTLDKTVPYSVSWNTVPYASGPHTLTAVGKDQAGNTTTSPPVTVTVTHIE